MLSDDEVLEVCYNWAGRFCSRFIEYDELVNVGYLVGKKLDNPKLLHKWIKYTMLHFVQDSSFIAQAIGIEDLHDDIVELTDTSFDELAFSIRREELKRAMVLLTPTEATVVQLKFWDGLTYKEIDEKLSYSSSSGQRSQQICTNALSKMRREFKRRMKK